MKKEKVQMRDLIKRKNIKKNGKWLVWILAAVIILNTCGNGIMGGVFAEGENVSVDDSKTEFSTIDNGTTDNTFCMGVDYSCQVNVNKANPDVTIEWKYIYISEDGSEYEYIGVDVKEASDAGVVLSLNENANDGDIFVVEVSSSDGEMKRSDEIHVSIPQAVEGVDYDYYYEDGSKAEKVNDWFDQKIFLKIAIGSNYNYIEINGELKDSYEINSMNDVLGLEFRLVNLDNGGNVIKKSSWSSPEINIDTDKPVISNIISSLADGEWSNSNVKVTVEATDSSGISAVKYSLTDSCDDAFDADEESSGIFTFTTAKSDGEQPTYHIWAVDKAGHISEASTFVVNVEYTKPQIVSIDNISANQWVNDGHKIKIGVKDDNVSSGIDYITYKTGTGEPVKVTDNEIVGDTVYFSFDTLREGSEYITDINEYTIKAYDLAKNESEASKTAVMVDKTNPNITAMTLITDDEWQEHRLNTNWGHFSKTKVKALVDIEKSSSLTRVNTVTLSYEDENNNTVMLTAAAIAVGAPDGNNQKYSAVFELEPKTMPFMYKNLRVKAEDEVKNVSVEKTYAQLNNGDVDNKDLNNLLIEQTPPTIKFDIDAIQGEGVYRDVDGKVWTDSHKTVNLSISDDGSGIYKYSKKLNDTVVKSVETDSLTKKISDESLSTDSKTEAGMTIDAKDKFLYQLEAEAVDNAGNITQESCSVYVDMIAPKTKSVSTTSIGWTSAESVTITVKADDEGSGVRDVLYYAVDSGDYANYPAEVNELKGWMSLNAGKAEKINDGEYGFTANGEQDKIYYIWTVDNVGNVSEATEQSVQIDLTNPQPKGIELENIVLSSPIGNFANKDVKVILNITDGNISSKIKSVQLLCGDKLIDESITTVSEDELYECVIPVNKEYENLSVKIVDNVGHECIVPIQDISENDSVTSSNIVLENKYAITDLSIAADSVTVKGNRWVGSDTEFIIEVTDNISIIKSGIHNVTAQINDITVLNQYYDSIVLKDEYSISTNYNDLGGTLPQPEDGKYTIKVTVTDNAGNKTESEKTIYIDREAPVVKSVELYSDNNSNNNNYEAFTRDNMLSYGNYYNTDAMIKVIYEDALPSSGIVESNICLYTDDVTLNPISTSLADEDQNRYEAWFSISKPCDTEVSIEIIDNVGHTSKKSGMSAYSNNINSDNLMLESNQSKINITTPEPVYNNEEKGQKWYNTNIDFNITEEDNQSGLRSSDIKLNGKNIISKKENGSKSLALEKKNYKVNTSENDRAADGSFMLSVTTVDNANNITEKTSTVYVDNTMPIITNYEFSLESYKEGNPAPIITGNYGYYFNQSVTVTVSADDAAPSSGLKKIKYYFDSVSDGKSEVSEKNVSDGKISFEVPNGFKGKIYTNVVDNVGNESGWQTVDGTIREETGLHNISSDVKIIPQIQTDKKDINGIDLYSQSVPILLHVEDIYSGVRKIEWRVEADGDSLQNQSGTLNIDNNALLSDDAGWNVLQYDNNLCTVLEKQILVSNNSNDIRVTVVMTDRSGNVSQNQYVFSIDMSAPQISVSYDNNDDDDVFEGYFKNTRVATVSIKERNFNYEDVQIQIQNSESSEPIKTEWVKVNNGSGNYDNAEYIMNILYQDDGDYTFSISCADLAGNVNSNVDYGNSIAPQSFTIDTKTPTITLSFDNNNAYGEGRYYYQDKRVASITITEHNFDASRVVVNVASRDNKGGDAGNAPAVSEWTTAGGDDRRASVSFSDDSNYTISVQYIDMAGNEAVQTNEEKFCIDQKDPEIIITGVSDHVATNAAVVAPVIEFKDTNIGSTNVTILGTNNNKLEINESSTPNDETKIYSLDNIKEDDIYTLTAETTDKSGRPKMQSLKFSVNRNGSTYELSTDTIKMLDTNNGYTNSPVDVIVKEVNVNSLSQDKLSVVVSKDNNPVELVQDTENSTNDYFVSRGDSDEEWSTWSEYIYTIRKKNFDEDGNYIVRLYSEDEADNVSQNNLQTKKADINFNVDKTDPNLSILNIEEGETYPEDTRTASIKVEDNTYVSDVTIYVNDELYEHYDADAIKDKTQNNENFEAIVLNSNDKQNIRIVAVDAAQNESSVEVGDFLVTTNLWVRFVNNKPLFYSVIGLGVLIIAGGAIILLVSKRKKA